MWTPYQSRQLEKSFEENSETLSLLLLDFKIFKLKSRIRKVNSTYPKVLEDALLLFKFQNQIQNTWYSTLFSVLVCLNLSIEPIIIKSSTSARIFLSSSIFFFLLLCFFLCNCHNYVEMMMIMKLQFS